MAASERASAPKVFGAIAPTYVHAPWFQVAIACAASGSRREAAAALRAAGFRWEGSLEPMTHRPGHEASERPTDVAWCYVDDGGAEIWNSGGESVDQVLNRLCPPSRPRPWTET